MARAGKWSEDRKALELAMCLTDDALNILLLLNPENRHDYKTLVGALRQRFGQFEQPKGVLCLALVDTGLTVTVIRPDVVPANDKLEPPLSDYTQ